jgi:hypothetical protein
MPGPAWSRPRARSASSSCAGSTPVMTRPAARCGSCPHWTDSAGWPRDCWSGAALGPRGFDLGWCRLDLYLLYDERIADAFGESYQTASAVTVPDLLLYDLWAAARSHRNVESWVPNYGDLGRTDLTAPALRQRHTAWTEHLIDRWGSPAAR